MNLHGTPVDELIAERIGIDPHSLTQKAVEAYQLEALRRTIAYAREHSDYYKETLSQTDPELITDLSDLSLIPFTTEHDLAGSEWRFQCIPASGVQRIVTVPTTGTHGHSKRLAFTDRDIRRSVEFIYRGYLTMDCYQGERMIVMMSGNTPGSIGDMVQQAMAPLGMEIMVYGTMTDIRDAYEKIMSFKPGVIEGIPWHTAAIARYGERYGNPEREFIRSVNLSADLVPDSIIDRLKRLWGCTVHRHYGMTEMCIFGGVECLHNNGYHMRSCDLLFEIPEPDENGFGEVVITTLDREAMPLIRYRTGDIGRLIADPCPCGSDLTRIEKLYGRASDRIAMNSGSCFFLDIANAVYRFDEIIDFDLEINSEPVLSAAPSESQTGSGLPNQCSRLHLTARTLPGEGIDEEALCSALCLIPGIGPALHKENALFISHEETEHFPEGYNLKKRVRAAFS